MTDRISSNRKKKGAFETSVLLIIVIQSASCFQSFITLRRPPSIIAATSTNTNRPKKWTNNRRYNKRGNAYNNKRRRSEGMSFNAKNRKLQQALEVELRVMTYLESTKHNKVSIIKNIPSTRECNAALATIADYDTLRHALRLFVKMRKCSSFKQNQFKVLPIPNMVTYSTLMSRANSCDKPYVALRLWRLMISSFTHNYDPCLVPDTKAFNILMNSYAKLGQSRFNLFSA